MTKKILLTTSLLLPLVAMSGAANAGASSWIPESSLSAKSKMVYAQAATPVRGASFGASAGHVYPDGTSHHADPDPFIRSQLVRDCPVRSDGR